MIASLLSAFVLTCAGCGGGGGSSDSSGTTAAAPPPIIKTVLIEAYGDSTMLGNSLINGVYVQVAQPAPAILQSLLQAKYGSIVTVVNHGVGGTTAAKLLSGDGVNLPWAQQMAQSKAQIVLFNYGINDSNEVGNTAAAFEQAENQLVQIAKAAGKTVVIETPNPVTYDLNAPMPSFVAASLSVASTWGITVIDEFAYLNTLPNWTSMLSDEIGLHPTQAGYQIKAEYEFKILDPIVAAALAP